MEGAWLNILCRLNTPLSAVQTYRQLTPLEGIVEFTEKDVQLVVDDIGKGRSASLREFVTQQADIIHMHSNLVASCYHPDHISRIQQSPPMLMDNWELKYPPGFVMDIDDLFDHVSPVNMAFIVWGIRGPDGELLKPGDSITAKAADGNEYLMWEDGVAPNPDEPNATFDVARNLQYIEDVTNCMKTAMGMTCSTKPLQEYMEAKLGREVFIMPNCVRIEDYRKLDLFPKPPTEVRILWQGGQSHFEDLSDNIQALKDLLKKYPNVKFLWWGQDFKGARKELPEDQVIFEKWVPIDAYHLQLATLNHDINWCPISNNMFNRHKSACKWYESSALHIPAATIAPRIGPYGDEIVDGETGLLYNDPTEFYQQMERLITTTHLRKTLAQNAHEWVWANRDIKVWAPKLKEYYQRILKEHYQKVDQIHAFV